MKIQAKLAIAIGLIALITSCQKDEMPSPYGYSTSGQESSNSRMGVPSNDETTPGAIEVDGTVTTDSSAIVGGGDDDRDGGGIIGGGDGDRDGGGDIISGGDGDRDGGGGNKVENPGKPK
jgi:hypothetical protein